MTDNNFPSLFQRQELGNKNFFFVDLSWLQLLRALNEFSQKVA